MKICAFSRVLPLHGRGGMQDHVFDLASGLANRGHSVILVSTQDPKDPGRLVVKQINENFKIYHLPWTKAGGHSRSWRVGSQKLFRQLHREVGFDVAHSQGHSALWLAPWNRTWGKKIPVAITLHGTYWDVAVSGFNVLSHPQNVGSVAAGSVQVAWGLYHHFWEALPVLRRFDAVIATSNEQRDRLRRTYRVPEGKLFLAYNGIDPEKFKPAPVDDAVYGRYGLRRGDFHLLCVARLVEEKGVQFAIRSLPGLREEIPHLRLVVIGDGLFAAHLRSLSRKLNVEDLVVFTGFLDLDELVPLYNLADVFVNLTLQENGYDLTVLQAMACAKPVVTTEIDSNPTVIHHRESGLLIRVGRVADIVESVLSLRREDSRTRLGMAARTRILESFTGAGMVRQIEEIFTAVTVGGTDPNVREREG